MIILRPFQPTLAVALVAFASLCIAQENETLTSNSAVAPQTDHEAIQESIAGYLAALNSRDVTAAASFWSQDGVWLAEDGRKFRGPDQIRKGLAEVLASEMEGTEVSLRDLNIRFVTPNVAIEDGVAVVSVPGEPRIESSYTVVHKREGSSWKIDSVRETQTPIPARGANQLKKLDWLIGDWVDDVPDVQISSSCQYVANDRFIRRTFRIENGDGVQLEGTQVIGWDARQGVIRSWAFDSDGGFANGIWTQSGTHTWTVEHTHQLEDGGVGTAINTYRILDDGSFEFQSTNRKLDDVEIEDTPVIRTIPQTSQNQ